MPPGRALLPAPTMLMSRIHPAPVQIGADRTLQVVDERVHLGVRGGPVEVSVGIRDVTVKGGDRRIDQLGHRLQRKVPPSRRIGLIDASLPPALELRRPKSNSVRACPDESLKRARSDGAGATA